MTEANNKGRLRFLDVAKGAGMMMIVWMHIHGNNHNISTFSYGCNELNSFIVSIYVPLFFVLSGYLLSFGGLDCKSKILKKVKSLLLPFAILYVFSFGVSILLSFLGIGVKHDFQWTNFFNPILSKTFFNGPLWFLLALFWSFVIVYIIFEISKKKEIFVAIISFILGVIGFYIHRFNITLPMFMGPGLVGAPLLIIGYFIRKYIYSFLVLNKWNVFAVMVIGFILNIMFSSSFSFQSNVYAGNFLPFIVSVFGGSLFFLCFSLIFEKYLKIFEIWGKYSLVVLCLHNFILIPITRIVGLFVHNQWAFSFLSLFLIYLVFLVLIPIVSKFCPSIFNIKINEKK